VDDSVKEAGRSSGQPATKILSVSVKVLEGDLPEDLLQVDIWWQISASGCIGLQRRREMPDMQKHQ
jgi:hypothetical protein